MADLGPIHEPVRFAFAAASCLAGELRGAAAELGGQVGVRRQEAAAARREWRGVYGEQFDGRVSTCTGDADRFASAFQRAANQLGELAERARAEERRRATAREWKQRQDDESVLDKIGDFFGGEDDVPPPPPADPPMRYVVEAPPQPCRGGAAPGGPS